MPFALWSILLVSFLPLLWTALAKAGAPYDNHQPRGAGGGHRLAPACQLGAAKCLGSLSQLCRSHVAGLDDEGAVARLDLLAVVYVLLRLGHGLCYISDKATLRSLCWLGGYAVVVLLFVSAAGLF
jgi:uncharacterized MAPEG superfamily protein